MENPENVRTTALDIKHPPSATTPLFLDFKPPPDSESYGNFSQQFKPRSERQRRHFMSYRGSSLPIAQVILNLLAPPILFAFASTLLTFSMHFNYPTMVWVYSSVGLLPAFFARQSHLSARRTGTATGWAGLSAFLLFLAYVGGAALGEVNFWYFSQPFFFLESLKTYTNIDPTEVSGVQLMDAGKVHFSEDAQLATDLAMSFTNWDVYCVAPITTAAGLPSQGSTLASYDLWAVGVNCCKSSETNFHCGEYNNNNARSGLRQVGEEQRSMFRLAVQQAEAAYNIRSDHPTFFYWVQDPQEQEGLFFATAFETWVLGNCVHVVFNAFCIVVFVLTLHKPAHFTN